MRAATKASPVVPPDVLLRAEELDALDAMLPFDRGDQLAELLTDDDVATLKHLGREGMGDNTMQALSSDLAYLEAWCFLATGAALAGAGKLGSQIRRPPFVGYSRA